MRNCKNLLPDCTSLFTTEKKRTNVLAQTGFIGRLHSDKMNEAKITAIHRNLTTTKTYVFDEFRQVEHFAIDDDPDVL